MKFGVFHHFHAHLLLFFSISENQEKMFCTVHFDEKMERMEKVKKLKEGLLFESWVEKKVFFANIKKSLNKTGKVERLLKKCTNFNETTKCN